MNTLDTYRALVQPPGTTGRKIIDATYRLYASLTRSWPSWIELLTTNQKAADSSPAERAQKRPAKTGLFLYLELLNYLDLRPLTTATELAPVAPRADALVDRAQRLGDDCLRLLARALGRLLPALAACVGLLRRKRTRRAELENRYGSVRQFRVSVSNHIS
jgi:hypothetical protein